MDVLIMEAANLFCGSHDPTKSNHLTISMLKLPAIEENYVSHAAGGAPIEIEIDTHINHLEAPFTLLGWTPYVMTLIGESRVDRQIFTAYGQIRQRRSGKAIQALAIMHGRLGRVNPTEFSRGQNQSHEYAIRGIVHYRLYIDNQEIYYWDFFTSARRVGGVDLNAELNRNLGIPTADAPSG